MHRSRYTMYKIVTLSKNRETNENNDEMEKKRKHYAMLQKIYSMKLLS